MTGHSPQPAEPAATVFFDRQRGAFFRRADWSAFWTVWALAMLLYLATLAPTVTMEDSGELAVAADRMGVAHPPGYPLWTLLAWFFQWVFHAASYHGYPNPARPIAMMSATFAALACGLLALLVSRSGADLMRGMRRTTRVLGLAVQTKICWTAGVAAGLLLAFSPVLWSQAVIIEVYALNAFFMILLLLMLYRWMARPAEDGTLYAAAYLFGLALTNHHTIAFLGPAFLLAMALRDRWLLRDLLMLAAPLAGLALLVLQWRAGAPWRTPLAGLNLAYPAALLLLLVPLAVGLRQRRGIRAWHRLLAAGGAVALGLAFYLYMPIASEQNPAHNWGYTRTWAGFVRSFTRGQYEQISPSNPFTDPALFLAQIQTFFHSLRAQFTLPTVVLAVLPFFYLHRLRRAGRTWLITLLTAFFFVSVFLVIFLNPTLDIQTLYIQRRFLILSHTVYALWLGYSIAFALSALEMGLARSPRLQPLKYAGLGLAFILPLIVLGRNFFSERQVTQLGGAEQRGHDFGWQFGYGLMEGAAGIRRDLQRQHDPQTFARLWADYPDPDYPPAIEPDAILFGGTDPGRFIPTYLIFSARVRPDVYLITQAALADPTYLSAMRDLYGDRIWIPATADTNRAFRQLVRQAREGRLGGDTEVSLVDGHVSIRGIGGVNEVNSMLARQIFEHNKHRHPFYLEESQAIEWMYPYLEPHGLIFRLHPEPVEFSEERMAQDRAFWRWYTQRLLDDRRFLRDIMVRKSFSKLRSSLAGYYAHHQRFTAAEEAFQQAIGLYPLNPEARYRLANLYLARQRIRDAHRTIGELLAGDPRNEQVRDFHRYLGALVVWDQRRRDLEDELRAGTSDIHLVLELAEAYLQLEREPQFERLAADLLQDDRFPPDVALRVADLYAAGGDRAGQERALLRYLERRPNNPAVWLDLAALQVRYPDRLDEGLQALRRALELGGEPVRDALRRDARFNAVRQHPDFRQLLPDRTPGPIPFGTR